MRGFYEDYQREKNDRHGGNIRDRPTIIKRGMGTSILWFLAKLLSTIIYTAVTALSSVGLTTLINKPLRDMLIEIVKKTFMGD